MVDKEFVETFEAVRTLVLSVVVLNIGGTTNGTLVNNDPSPTCFPKIVPAEIDEKKPKLVDMEFVETFEAVRTFVLRVVVLRTGGTA